MPRVIIGLQIGIFCLRRQFLAGGARFHFWTFTGGFPTQQDWPRDIHPGQIPDAQLLPYSRHNFTLSYCDQSEGREKVCSMWYLVQHQLACAELQTFAFFSHRRKCIHVFWLMLMTNAYDSRATETMMASIFWNTLSKTCTPEDFFDRLSNDCVY